MVPKPGLEPGRDTPLPPQDSVSTKFHHFGTILFLIAGVSFSRRFGRKGHRRCTRCFFRHRRCGLLLDRRLCVQHNGLIGPVAGRVCQPQRGYHKDDGHYGCCFSQKRRRPGTSEKGLTGAPAKGSAHIRPFSGLQQYDHNEGDTDGYMQYDE